MMTNRDGCRQQALEMGCFMKEFYGYKKIRFYRGLYVLYKYTYNPQFLPQYRYIVICTERGIKEKYL